MASASPSQSPTSGDDDDNSGLVPWMIGILVAAALLLLLALRLLWYTYQVLLRHPPHPRGHREGGFASSKAVMPSFAAPKPLGKLSKAASSGTVADANVRKQGPVQVLSKDAWQDAHLVLLRSGALVCYASMILTREGHATYCAELWSLEPEQLGAARAQRRQGSSHRFVVDTALGGLHLATSSRAGTEAWMAELEKSVGKSARAEPGSRRHRSHSSHRSHGHHSHRSHSNSRSNSRSQSRRRVMSIHELNDDDSDSDSDDRAQGQRQDERFSLDLDVV